MLRVKQDMCHLFHTAPFTSKQSREASFLSAQRSQTPRGEIMVEKLRSCKTKSRLGVQNLGVGHPTNNVAFD